MSGIELLPAAVDQAAVIRERLNVSAAQFEAAVAQAVVRQAGAGHAPLTLAIEELRTGSATGTAGVWRLSGSTVGGDSYGLILKGLWITTDAEADSQRRADALALYGPAGVEMWRPSDSPDHPFYGLRELEFYRSAILAPPGAHGVRAPEFYGELRPDGPGEAMRAGIFLEDVAGRSGVEMSTVELLGVTRALGAMQGSLFLDHLSGQSKAEPWMARGYQHEATRRSDALVDESRPLWTEIDTWRRPTLAPLLDGFNGMTVFEASMRLWERRYDLLDVLGQLPTVAPSHQDFWNAQFVKADSDNSVVVIDFASFGLAPLGTDAAKLAQETMRRDMPSLEDCRQIDQQIFDAYLAGLHDAGVNTADPTVRAMLELGYTLPAATDSFRLAGDEVKRAVAYEDQGQRRSSWGDAPVERVYEFYRDRTVILLEKAQRNADLTEQLRGALGRPLSIDQARLPSKAAATVMVATDAQRELRKGATLPTSDTSQRR